MQKILTMPGIPSIHKRLIELIQEKEPGEILFPGDFLELGSPEAIHMALSRLTEEKILVRLGKGIYVKPKTDPLLGQVLPSLEEVAHKIAAKEKVLIRPTGAYALNKLGLSTQVPTKVVYLTNGSRRTIRVGRGTITFKSTTPKKLAATNDAVFLAIQALLTIGENEITPKVIDTLVKALRRESPAAIREDAKFAPHYIARTLYLIADKLERND